MKSWIDYRMADIKLQLNKLKELVKINPDSVDNNQVVLMLEEYDKTVITNCDTAAQLLFEAVTLFCMKKPDLVSRLLQIALEPLFRLGIEKPDQVFSWLQSYLTGPSSKDFMSNAEKEWLQKDTCLHAHYAYFSQWPDAACSLRDASCNCLLCKLQLPGWQTVVQDIGLQ